AEQFAREHVGQISLTRRVIGFCLVIRREVIATIGGLDERFGTGHFEDDDYCIRAAIAGFKIAIVEDAFVHHVGGRTFAGARVDYTRAMRANWETFRAKWGIAPEHDVWKNGYPIATLQAQPFQPEHHVCPLPADATTFVEPRHRPYPDPL